MWALAVIRPAGMKLPYRNTGRQAPYAAMAYQGGNIALCEQKF